MGIVWFILLGSLYLFSAFFLYRTSPLLSALIILIGLIDFTIRGIRPNLKRMLRNRRIRKTIDAVISDHIRVLVRKREDMVKTDDYGIVHFEDWDREKEYFIDNVIRENLPDLDSEDFPIPFLGIDLMIDRRIDDFIGKGLAGGTIHRYPGERWEDEDQQAYCRYCSGLLGLSGWKTAPVEEGGPGNGHIIAEKGGRRFVLTCIRTSSPVGRRHIREMAETMQEHKADMGAVVTNAGFSRWALRGASRYKVLALHHDDLTNIG